MKLRIEVLPARGQSESLSRPDQECDAGGLAGNERLDNTIGGLAAQTPKRFTRNDSDRSSAPTRLDNPWRREARLVTERYGRRRRDAGRLPVLSEGEFVRCEAHCVR